MDFRVKLKFCFILIVVFTKISFVFSQSLMINEVMSSNTNVFMDEDGDYSDWVEIYNNSNTSVNLEGYGLSDNENEPFKWLFPTCVINPQEYLLIFASKKNKQSFAKHWETIINWRDVWKYQTGSPSIPLIWKEKSFNDTNWPSGPSGFGYGDGDDATVVETPNSIYIRKRFVVSSIENISNAIFHVDYDDGFVAYLNGEEIARANLGQSGIYVPYDQGADTWREATMYENGSPDQFEINNIESILQTGENVLAVQVHNNNSSSSDMSLIPFFTLGMNTPPANPKGIPEILKSFLPKLHTNFKIKSEGETLLLTNSSGEIIDIVNIPEIPDNLSWGRKNDFSSNYLYFTNPTPGNSNESTGFNGICNEPHFSSSGGFYSSNIGLVLNSDEGCTVRYATGGNAPTESSPVYSRTIELSSTTILRAKCFKEGMLPSRIITQS